MLVRYCSHVDAINMGAIPERYRSNTVAIPKILRGAKRLECVELAPALRAATLNDSASKLDALRALRVTPMPLFPYVSVFRAAHT